MVQTVEPVIVRKKLRVPREFAFRAWTEADRTKQWLARPGEICEVETFEAFAGGPFRLAFSNEQSSYRIEGSFVEVVPPEKLVLTWRRYGMDADPATTRVTVTFASIEGGTEIEIRHELLPDEEAAERLFGFWVEAANRLSGSASMMYMMEEYSVSATMESPTGWAGKLADEKAATQRAIARFNDTYGCVPDDKLHFKVTETTKSPLRLAAHIGASNMHFASVMRGEPQLNTELPAIFAAIEAEEQRYTTKEAVEDYLKRSQHEILEAFEKVSPEVLAGNPQLQFYVGLPAYHHANHAAQIDYIQTTWGDMQNHFGM